MNKYRDLNRQVKRQRSKKKMCLDKVAFETESLAYQKGQRIYKCKHCGKWHRSGKIAALIAMVRKVNNNKN